jgi:hypothetical protein
MTQAPLFIAIYLLGLAINLAWGPRARLSSCCALGFPVGLAATVVIVLIMLVVGLPYNGWTLASAALLVVVAATVALRPRLSRAAALTAAGWALGFAVVASALSYANFSLMTADSHQFVMLGRVIGADGAFAEGTISELQGWGVFQAIAHSLFRLTREDYLYALQPVLAASFLPVFVLSLWAGVEALGAQGRPAKLLVALITTALFSIYMFHRHFLYIHTNLAAAIYLFGFALLFWLAEMSQDASGIPVALLCLLGFTLQRIEAPVFTLIFLVVCVAPSQLPRRAITPWLTALTVIVAAWYEVLARHVPADGEFLTPTLSRLFGGFVVAFYAYYLGVAWPPIRRLGRWLPQSMALVCLLGLVASFVLKPSHMLVSAQAWASNLLQLPYWGQACYAIAALVLLGLALEAPPHRRVFTYGVGLSLVVILLLGFGRVPYKPGVGDSANRMTLHVLPLLFAYLGLKLIPALARPKEASAVDVSPNETASPSPTASFEAFEAQLRDLITDQAKTEQGDTRQDGEHRSHGDALTVE